jgi:hypothetical protein
MKKAILLIAFNFCMLLSISASAQQVSSNSAVFNYTRAGVVKAINEKHLEFSTDASHLPVIQQKIKAKALSEKIDFTFTQAPEGKIICSMLFKQEVPMILLTRFFVTSDLNEIVLTNEKQDAQTFFANLK